MSNKYARSNALHHKILLLTWPVFKWEVLSATKSICEVLCLFASTVIWYHCIKRAVYCTDWHNLKKKIHQRIDWKCLIGENLVHLVRQTLTWRHAFYHVHLQCTIIIVSAKFIKTSFFFISKHSIFLLTESPLDLGWKTGFLLGEDRFRIVLCRCHGCFYLITMTS